MEVDDGCSKSKVGVSEGKRWVENDGWVEGKVSEGQR